MSGLLIYLDLNLNNLGFHNDLLYIYFGFTVEIFKLACELIGTAYAFIVIHVGFTIDLQAHFCTPQLA